MQSDRDESAVENVPAVPFHHDPYADEQNEDVVSLIQSFQAEALGPGGHKRQCVDSLKAISISISSNVWFKKLKLLSPLGLFRHTVAEREEASLSVSTPIDLQQRFDINFLSNINWSALSSMFKEWIEHPRNVALLIWLICVSVSSAMLAMLLLGLLDEGFPTKASRNHWIEINNQVLNALFTLMSLYQHPNLFLHLFLLCRWRSNDITALRKVYSKNGAYKPHEWIHMMIVVLLLHITCFAQYISCALYWGYDSEKRPEFAEIFFSALGFAAPVFAGAYSVYSPLGREYEIELDEESQCPNYEQATIKVGMKLYKLRNLVKKPKWSGGLFDCMDDVPVFCLSFFCTFCVFGWNMERLGFGNMYVHIVTFLLLCFAPFWIFNISAINIDDSIIGDMVGTAGIVLCVFGLLYGGFWRIQMRKRFKLPGNNFCGQSDSFTDYIQWMFCWSCSLAQEVRTGNLYEVEDDSVYRKNMDDSEDNHPFLHPLPHERGMNSIGKLQYDSSILVSYPAKLPTYVSTADQFKIQEDHSHEIKEKPLTQNFDVNMKPPVQQLIPSEITRNI
ncbi:hypothetical protein Cni_G25104 [Canna indica]|uniref:PLAC8 family protein n=1 Tax=Canna indica TaxID=4628 RepID=A0AAQ3KWF6_9LILI|nr:hypothetical protein Cni_G25104 [Canna indica]